MEQAKCFTCLQILVRYVNNSTRILPNHTIEIVRVNNYNPDPKFLRSGGYSMSNVYEFGKNLSETDGIYILFSST
jgi:hypothetical protein